MVQTVSWGEAIENSYQRYLNFGNEPRWDNWKVYPKAYYTQLEKDMFVAPDVWRQMMPHARDSIIGELRASAEMITTKKNIHPDVMKGIRAATEKEIEEYKSGSKDDLVELRAKQYIILSLFKEAKHKNVKHLYEPDTSTLPK